MKKRFKLWVAYMLILCMSMAVMLPNSKPVKAEEKAGDGELVIDEFFVYKDRDGLNSSIELRDNEELRVGIKWSLSDSDRTNNKFSTVIQDEDYSNIGFYDKQEVDLTYQEEVVGKLRIIVDDDSGNVTLSASFNDEYLEKTKRNGGGFIFAYADVNMGTEADGTEQEISIRDDKYPFTYKNDGRNRSTLWVWKSAQGKMYNDGSGNKQDFYVSLQTNGGKVTDVQLSDAAGSGLELSDPITIKIEESTVNGITEGSEMTLQELQSRLTSMPDDAKIGFTYTAGVDENVYSESASQNGNYRNTFKAEYKNNESEQQKAESSANVSVSRPYVGKNGEILKDAAGKPTGKIKWTVKITLNDLAGEEITLGDITDTYLDGASNKVLKPIEKDGKVSGYELTYETDIPAEDMNSLSDHTYTNDVTVSIDGHNYSGRGQAYLPAKSWISKYFENYDAENKRLSWRIVCEVPPNAENITGVSLSDWQEWSTGQHSVISDSFRIEVDGVVSTVPDVDWLEEQQFWLENGGNIKFSDDYFATLKGKTFTVYVDTKIENDSIDGRTYINKAQLQYSLNGTATTLEALAEWNYDSAIKKTGASDSSATAIDYIVDIDLSKLELNAGTSIIVKDILPEGLTLDKDSCDVIGTPKYSWDGGYTDPDLTAALNVTVGVDGRNISFEIPVTEEMINRIQTIKNNDEYVEKVTLGLKYKAKISDVRKYLTDGAELTFTNTASAEYGGKKIGDSINVTKLTPKQMIEKNMVYDYTTAPNMYYTIKVNPDRLDLSDGSLTVTDTMGEKLMYRLDTILVQKYEGDNLVSLVNGKDYRYVYSRKDNSVVFTLPDSESLVISYEAYVNADIDMNLESNDELNEQNSFNRVSISGYSNGNGSSKVYFSGKAITPSGWAAGTTNYARLFKIYKSKNGTVMLDGCKFSLVEYSLNNGKLIAGRTINDDVVTDEDGFVKLDGMKGGQLYGLVETGVPEGGFTVKKQPLYFIFGNSDENPFPAEYGVIYVNDGAPIIFENDPPGEEEEESSEEGSSSGATVPSEEGSSSGATVPSEEGSSSGATVPSEEGSSSGATKPSEEGSSSGATVPSEEGSSSEATKPSVTEEDPTKKGDVEGEGNTTVNPPSQPEKETSAPQTETVTEPEGETDPDNDRNGELEGEGNLVNTSDRPYIKVILVFLILGVVAAAVTEITMLCSGTED